MTWKKPELVGAHISDTFPVRTIASTEIRLNFTCNPHWQCELCLYDVTYSHIQFSLLIYRLAEAGHRVVGVDISEIAVKGFFIDNHLPYEKKRIGKLMRYRVSLCNTPSLSLSSAPIHHFHSSVLVLCLWNVPPSSQYLYSLCFNLS